MQLHGAYKCAETSELNQRERERVRERERTRTRKAVRGGVREAWCTFLDEVY